MTKSIAEIRDEMVKEFLCSAFDPNEAYCYQKGIDDILKRLEKENLIIKPARENVQNRGEI